MTGTLTGVAEVRKAPDLLITFNAPANSLRKPAIIGLTLCWPCSLPPQLYQHALNTKEK
jgi:hypothetical protein